MLDQDPRLLELLTQEGKGFVCVGAIYMKGDVLKYPSYVNVIMSLKLKVMWQNCLTNTMLIFEEQH